MKREILNSRTNSEEVIKQIYNSEPKIFYLQNKQVNYSLLKSIFNKHYYIENMVLTDSLLSEFSEYLKEYENENSNETDVLKISIQVKILKKQLY